MCAVQRNADWETVSRTLHELSDSPPLSIGERFGRRNCARQYDALLRRHGSVDALVTQLRDRRIHQLRRSINDVRTRYQRLAQQLGQLREGLLDDRLDDLLATADADDAAEDDGRDSDEPKLKRRKVVVSEESDNSGRPGACPDLSTSGFVSIKLSDIKREQCLDSASENSPAVSTRDVTESLCQSSATQSSMKLPSDTTTNTVSGTFKPPESTAAAALSNTKGAVSPVSSSNTPEQSETVASTSPFSSTIESSAVISSSACSTSITSSLIVSTISSNSSSSTTSSNTEESIVTVTDNLTSISAPETSANVPNSEDSSKMSETVVPKSDESEGVLFSATPVAVGNSSPPPVEDASEDSVRADSAQTSSPQPEPDPKPCQPSSEEPSAVKTVSEQCTVKESSVEKVSTDTADVQFEDGVTREASPYTDPVASDDHVDTGDKPSTEQLAQDQESVSLTDAKVEQESDQRERRRSDRALFVRLEGETAVRTDSDTESVSTDLAASPASTADVPDTADLRLWRRSALLVWREIAALRPAGIFLRPIGDTLAPGYSDAVLRPMDLQSLRRAIDSGSVTSPVVFKRDLFLMLANAAMFNSRCHHVHVQARQMWRECGEKLRAVWPQLENAAVAGGCVSAGAVGGVRRETREEHKRRHSVDVEVPRSSSQRKRRL